MEKFNQQEAFTPTVIGAKPVSRLQFLMENQGDGFIADSPEEAEFIRSHYGVEPLLTYDEVQATEMGYNTKQ